jgi:hypothetical protein
MAFLIETAQDNSIRVNEGQRTARCILITEGLGNLRDKNLYLSDAVESAVKVFEGAQCYLDHPSTIDEESRPERSVRDLLGWFSDCGLTTVRDPNTGDKLTACVATLHFSEAEPGEIAFQQVKAALQYKKQYPNSKAVYAGLSINAGGLSEEAEIDGLGTVNAVHEITDVFSCDLVTKPARGGTFLGLSESYRSPVRFGGARVKESRAAEQLRLTLEAQGAVENHGGALRTSDGRVIAYADKFLGFAKGTLVESDAEAVLADMIGKVTTLMDQADEDPDLDGDDDLDEIPMDSVMDDLEHKKSIRRSMGKPDKEVGDQKYPEPVDVWQTSEDEEEGEVPPGIISGDPVLHDSERSRRPSQGRSRHESAAVRHFANTYEGAGNGMAGATTIRSTPVVRTEQGDDRLDKADPAVNFRYSTAVTEGRACGFCKFFVPNDDADPAAGGGCQKILGSVQFTTICDLFEPKSDAQSTFNDTYAG